MSLRNQRMNAVAAALLTSMSLWPLSTLRAEDEGAQPGATAEAREEGQMPETPAKDPNVETPTDAAPRSVVLEEVVRIAEEFGKRTEAAYHQTRQWVSARSICLQAAGARNADYETLMTVSGLGLGFSYHPKVFGPT